MRLTHRGAYGLAAVEYDPPVLVALRAHGAGDGVTDEDRVLGTGIVLGDDDAIGELSGRLTHGLAAIDALAARCPEHHGKLAVGITRAQIA